MTKHTNRWWVGLGATVLCLAQGCGQQSAEPDTPPHKGESADVQSASLSEEDYSCNVVPEEYAGASDGCDCPANGDTSCDPDCAAQGNGGGEWCGCDYCYTADSEPESAGDDGDNGDEVSDFTGASAFSLTLPDRMSPEDVTISARSILHVGDNVEVRRGERGYGRIVNTGHEYTRVGSGSRVGETWTQCWFDLDEGGKVEGPVIASDGINANEDDIAGGIESVPTMPNPKDTHWDPELPDPGSDVDASDTDQLAPGGHGSVDVGDGQSIRLDDGTYRIGGDLTVSSGGTLVIDDSEGPVIIYVDGDFNFDGTITNGDGAYDPELEVLIVGLGGGDVRLGGPFTGSVHAPLSNVDLEHPGEPNYSGSFFGGNVRLGDGVVVRHMPFPWGHLLPPANDDWGPSTIHLDAWLDYETGEGTPGEVTLPESRLFAIPAFLQVRSGNSGDGTAVLRFRDGNGPITECIYRGAAGVSHPTDEVARLAGLSYDFEECSGGRLVGERVPVTWVSLEVLDGDNEHPAGTTSVVLDSGDGCSAYIPPPLQPTEVAKLKRDFSWTTAAALNETDPDGNAAIWHGLIYIENQEQLEALDRLRVFWSARPLSPSYNESFRGLCGRVEHATDGEGVVVYAIFPAKLFNILRDAGQEAIGAGIDPPFRFIIPSTPDPEYANPDGSVAYSALADSGFHRWLAEQGTAQPGFWKKITKPFRDAANWVVDNLLEPVVGDVVPTVFSYVASGFDGLIDFSLPFIDDIWEGTQVVLGAIAREFNADVDVRLHFRIINSEAGFPGDSYLVRAWGPACTADEMAADRCGGGGPHDTASPRTSNGDRPILVPESAQVRVRQWAAFLPIMDQDRMDEKGFVHLHPLRDRGTRGGDLCIELDTDYGMITTDFIPNEVCDFNRDRFRRFRRDVTRTVDVNQDDLFALSQIKDGHDFNQQIIGYEPHRADVLTGWVANNMTRTLNGATRAMALCLDFPSVGGGAIEAISGGLGIPVVGALLRKDIWWPDDGDSRRSRSSRVMTHEYGHFTMCDLLYEDEGASGLTGLIARIVDGENRDSDIGQMTEAFADVYISQVAGGVNYIPPHGTRRTSSVAYCTQPDCLDTNYTGNGDVPLVASGYHQQLGRWESMIHDFFDTVDDNPSDGIQRPIDGPSNGDYWIVDAAGDYVFSSNGYLNWEDETVEVSGRAWRDWVSRWLDRGSIPNKENVIGGLFDAARETHSWCQVCEIAAAHSPNAANAIRMTDSASAGSRTPGVVLDRMQFCAGDAETLDFIGAPPSDVDFLDITCNACASNEFVNQSTGQCEACPVGEVPSAGGCSACPAGTVPSGGQCTACPSNQIVDGASCVECPASMGPNADQTACVLCDADITVDWSSMTDACSQYTRVAVRPDGGAGDNCPDTFWADVINLDQGALGTDFELFYINPFFDPDIGALQQCVSAEASTRAYLFRDVDELGLLGTSSGQGEFSECNLELACPPNECTLPDGPGFSPSNLASADQRLRFKVESNESTSVWLDMQPDGTPPGCGIR